MLSKINRHDAVYKIIRLYAPQLRGVLLVACAVFLCIALVGMAFDERVGAWRQWPSAAQNGILFGAIVIAVSLLVAVALGFLFLVNLSLSRSLGRTDDDLSAAKVHAKRAREIAERIEASLRS